MKKNTLGSTPLLISAIGLGTVKFGRNQGVKYPKSFEIPDDKQIARLLEDCQALSINLLDTAPAYGNSEERLGSLLKNRHDWILSTKVGEEFIAGNSFYDFTPEHTRFSIERSLKRLKTDYIDLVLVHSDGNDVHNIQHFGILDCLAEIKKQGLIRAFGMSTKTIEGGLLTLKKADCVMVMHHPNYTAEQPVIEAAFKANKGVLIKKALASGHIHTLPGNNPVQTSLKFIMETPGVSSIIVGTLNPQHLLEITSFIPKK